MQFFGENWAGVRGACERETSPTCAADGFPFHFHSPGRNRADVARRDRAEGALGTQPRVAALLKRFSLAFFFHRSFARVSPVFAATLLSALFVGCSASLAASSTSNSNSHSNTSSADPAATVRRQSASTQFVRAQEQRTTLSNKSPEKRTLEDYKQVVNTFRRVYLITPHAPEVPDALLAVAEIYTEMGERFGRSYFQSAVDTYQFLIREYPASRYCPDAYLRSGKLQKDQLGD